MSAKLNRPKTESSLGRILRNTAWLLGGKGFGAVCSIAYLAILTRTLGLKDFGHFSLIFGTAQAIIALTGFQTWRVVVRYGSTHVHEKEWGRFGRLAMLCGGLDAIGAVLGTVVAAVAIFGFGHMLELNQSYVNVAFWFCCASLWALVSAPTGVVRALNRFDAAVYVEAVVPTGRLLAALLIWFTGPSVARFLFAWALIDLIEAALYWIVARRLCPEALRLSNFARMRAALRENEGITHFFLVSYFGSSIDALMKNGPLLIVGGWVSTRAAGLYRLASQLSQAMSKLSTLLTRSVYAEVAHVTASSEAAELRKLVAQTSKIAGGAALLVVILAVVAGKYLLQLIGGDDFEQGASILVPLAIGASFDLASVSFEPVLHSTGRANLSLFARVVALVAMGIALVFLIGHGSTGVAWAVAIGGACSYLFMGALAMRTLHRIEREEQAAKDPARDLA